MKTIAMVVILYGKRFEESKTLQSLTRFSHQLDQLLIVNNGPENLDSHDPFFIALSKKHKHVEFENQIQNKPLSWIYNDFINAIDADYYVLFDDDTEINSSYENFLFQMNNIDLELPKIISIIDKKQYYPKLNEQIISENGVIERRGELFSIGSGLIISNKIKKIFKKYDLELFDSRFALYGVDFSFFRRLNKLGRDNFLISSQTYLDHGLSRAEGVASFWRKEERLFDEVLSIKYYTSSPNLKIFKRIIQQVFRFNFKSAVKIFFIFSNGKHPRCNLDMRK
ncbi:glycosyl transferase [Acinetobacter baylyi]|uniref:glycosyltransferase family 2 protein n=1 Tax=Acinetobacter baylyi TaxID=202950 RepID=UPI0031E47AE4